jgi:hypothetical protein
VSPGPPADGPADGEAASEPDVQAKLLAVLGHVSVTYLVRHARTNPRAFLGLLGRILPLQHRARPPEPLRVRLLTFTATAPYDDPHDP